MGAVTATGPQLAAASPSRTVHASALSGASDVSRADLLDARTAAVSRDSRRDALADAADARLVDLAESQARQRNAALAQFAKQAEAQADKIALNQWVLPVEGYHLTASFGQSSGLWATTHTGLDFAAPEGTPIRAIANGVVTSTGYDGSYGNKTVVTLEDGTELWFCHQSADLGQLRTAGPRRRGHRRRRLDRQRHRPAPAPRGPPRRRRPGRPLRGAAVVHGLSAAEPRPPATASRPVRSAAAGA